MQLYSVSIGEIESDIVDYFVQRYGTNPVQLTPAADLRKMYNFGGAAWTELGDTISNLPWMMHLGARLSQNNMMTVSTVAQLAYLICSRMHHVVAAPSTEQVTPLRSAMDLSADAYPKRARAILAAQAGQGDQHFLPIWGYPVTLYNTIKPQPSDWQFVYFDNADTTAALGYHDITKDGQPVAKVFVETTIAAHEVVSVTACHELFEMVIDPIANLWAAADDGTEYAYEMSDPVEEDTFLVDDIAMSNFVHPSWFEPFEHPSGTKFDHLGLLTKPFSMTKGGYIITKNNGKVKEVFGSKAKAKRFAKEDRRGHRSEYRKTTRY
jgi:hypothetical protein